jgi:hypothetical protein
MPLKRRTAKKFGGDMDAAIALFEQMRGLPCTCTLRAHGIRSSDCPGCRRWFELEHGLRHALDLRLWHFPVIARAAPDPHYAWPDDSKQARYLQLEAALEARRQRAAEGLHTAEDVHTADIPAPVQ